MNTQNKMVLLEAIVSAACFVIEDVFFFSYIFVVLLRSESVICKLLFK